MVSLWSSNASMGEAGNPESSSSVARSYLNSVRSVVPLKQTVWVNWYDGRG